MTGGASPSSESRDMTATDMTNLPDPVRDAELYADVPTKRLFAWVIDVVLISLITLLLLPVTLFTAIFYLPFLYALVSFLYRWVTLSRRSATPGMRMAAISLRQSNGDAFDTTTAFLHTAGYFVSLAVFPLQLISIAAMLIGERKQGLTDLLLGTAALNARAR